jgi:hypothetical protein
VRQALSIRYELKRACGLEGEGESVERFGRNIRNPQVHVPLPLTATCQLQELSLKAERNTYIWPLAAVQISPSRSIRLSAIGKSGR